MSCFRSGIANTGIRIVPRPNPETKVRSEASKATMLIIIISIYFGNLIGDILLSGIFTMNDGTNRIFY